MRSSAERPFVEVVPLVKVEEQQLSEIKKARRPQYVYIPTAEQYNLVADLDRVMTIEKAVVAQWNRQQGCTNDQEIRALGEALARKRVRFAFPDDFNRFASKLQKRLKDKHSKASDQGKALRALLEIRVQPSPDWNAKQVKLTFYFIRHENQINFEKKGWNELLKEWLKLIPESSRFQEVNAQVITLEDMTAKEYVESDRLDLDHLSSS